MNEIIKIMTCGDVDNGKSTILGHILYDNNLIYEDQKSKIKDQQYAHILDGLAAEQEQNITIDVAYRFFELNNRKYILADCPGHAQYTKNMATGASVSDICLLVIDIEKGFTEQSKHHLNICSFMGITNFIILINKMDTINYDEIKFNKITLDIQNYFIDNEINIDQIYYIPVSGLYGENLDHKSDKIYWYIGKDLLTLLKDYQFISSNKFIEQPILLVQYISQQNQKRYIEGNLVSGKLKLNDKIKVLPSNQEAFIKEIYYNTKHNTSILIDRELDISRGNVIISDITTAVQVSNNCIIDLLLFEPINKSKDYVFKNENNKILCQINSSLDKINIVNKNLELRFQQAIPISLENNNLNHFILIDIKSNKVVGYGKIKEIKEDIIQTNSVLWFTGLSGSGKTTLAKALQQQYPEYNFIILDGDEIRKEINKDLGFTIEERLENIRRIAEFAKLLMVQNKNVIVSCISPTESCRQLAKDIIGKSFKEIYLSTPFSVCAQRDVKGWYKNTPELFTGLDSSFEIPQFADLELDTSNKTIDECILQIKKVI